MSYKALYRKYRPQKFEEVAGQEAIVRTLKNALVQNKIAHAYLFSGPRGTGKTSMAKLFAKALNCEEGIGHECNTCESCKSIIEGSHPDVIEIDAASNNGVEEVRAIVDKVKYLPLKGRYKVYIIDEVHMMSSSAFNALLKTLEEPPSHVIFILATTEPHKVLPTILSRCQRYEFSKVEDKDILLRMKEILASENTPYDEGALKIIVNLADGGVRDALSMLDQVVAYSNGKVTEEDVLEIFAIASKTEKINLIKALNSHDIHKTLEKISHFVDKGINIPTLVSNMLDILRDELVYQQGGSKDQLITLNYDEAMDLSQSMNKKTLMTMIDVLLKTQNDFKTVSNIRSLFEIVLLKLCSIDSQEEAPRSFVDQTPTTQEKIEVKTPVDTVETPKPVVNFSQPVVNTPVTPKVEPKPQPEPQVIQHTIPNQSSTQWDKPSLTNAESSYKLDDDTIVKLMVMGNRAERLKITELWNNLGNFRGNLELGKLALLLNDGKPYIVTNQAIVLEFDLSTLAKKVNLKGNQETLGKIIEELSGSKKFIYAVSHDDAMRLTKYFASLRQISKLPKLSEINLTFPPEGE